MNPVATLNLEEICVQTLAARLRAHRLRTGWSLEELAERAGVSRSTLHHLEHGTTPHPRLLTLHRLAKAFGVEMEALVPQREIEDPADSEPEGAPTRARSIGVSRESGIAGHNEYPRQSILPKTGREVRESRETGGREAEGLETGCLATGDLPPGGLNLPTGESIPTGLASSSATRGLGEVEPGLFRDWTGADWALWETHLASMGEVGLDRVRQAACEVNRQRETRRQLQALLRSPLAGVATQLIQTLFETACWGTQVGHVPPA